MGQEKKQRTREWKWEGKENETEDKKGDDEKDGWKGKKETRG